jgi:hypothetical protein
VNLRPYIFTTMLACQSARDVARHQLSFIAGAWTMTTDGTW